MKVAVVRNHRNQGVIHRFGQPCPETYGRRSVQMVMDSLRACGHTIEVFEGDMTLLDALRSFPGHPGADGRPEGMVFNLAYGVQGQSRYTHVPAMLEMAGVPYTGADPLGHAVSLDKVVAKILMRAAGVATPAFTVIGEAGGDAGGLRYPLVVKPRHESTSYGLRVVGDAAELADAVDAVVRDYRQRALVEEFVDGREFCVGLLGNSDPEVLPVVELDFAGRDMRAMTWEDKYHKRDDEPDKVCPADIPEPLARKLRDLSVATFRACHCKDYARVDIRVDRTGRPHVLEINSMASLGAGGSYVLAARRAGYDFTALVARILDVAHERYFGAPAPRDRLASATVPRAAGPQTEARRDRHESPEPLHGG
ncbi:MAG: D-alanine--D-alanine ligase family protein [Planctomycetota bacterium]|jgi:D-alanine-D-alanine ligase